MTPIEPVCRTCLSWKLKGFTREVTPVMYGVCWHGAAAVDYRAIVPAGHTCPQYAPKFTWVETRVTP